jgi:hypothetical protein
MIRRFAASLTAALVAAATVLACSSSETGTTPSGGSDPNDRGGSVSAKYTCCLNDVFYACPDQSAFDKCAGSNPTACHAACAASDIDCHMKCDQQAGSAKHDPSACTRRNEACPATGGGGGGGGSGGGGALCTRVGIRDCSLDSQCGSGNHCADGKCYPNDTGSKCALDSQCGSGNHCTNACCQSNSIGTTCSLDSQCGSGNHCTNGKCYSGALGNPCSLDSHCNSRNCTNGKCS